MHRTTLVYKNYFDFPFITRNSDNHGIAIVQLDHDDIFLGESDLILWFLWPAFI